MNVQEKIFHDISISDLTRRVDQIIAYLESGYKLFIDTAIPVIDIHDIHDEDVRDKLTWYNKIYNQAANSDFEYSSGDEESFPFISIEATQHNMGNNTIITYDMSISNFDIYSTISLDKNKLYNFLNILHHILTTLSGNFLPEYIGPLIKGDST